MRSRHFILEMFPIPFFALATSFAALAVAGCGGSTPPASSPAESSEPAAAASGAAPSAPAEKGNGTATAPASGGEKAAASDADAKAGGGENADSEGPLRQALTKPGVIFMFSFNDSDTKKAAEQACSKEASDPKKGAECMSKAQKKIDVNGQRFKQEGGSWQWMTVQRHGSSLVTLHKVEFDFGPETAKGIVIKPKGKDKGSKPWAKVPGEVNIEMTGGDEIVLTDPQHGRMVYQAKLGMTGDQ